MAHEAASTGPGILDNALARAVSEGVLLVSADGRVQEANDAALRMFGAQTLAGADVAALLPDVTSGRLHLVGRRKEDRTSAATAARRAAAVPCRPTSARPRPR